jgi:RHS repeat-associated protein
MAMSVVYTNFGGQLVHEMRGGVETAYVADALGSVIMCQSASGVTTYTADYWPYGEVAASTGTNPSPWGFAGVFGYFADNVAALIYIRARFYAAFYGNWATADPLWPQQRAYAYCGGAPTQMTDPSGLILWGCIACGVCVGLAVVAALIECLGKPGGVLNCLACYCGQHPTVCSAIITVCAVACATCIGQFAGYLASLLRGAIGVGALAPGVAGAAGGWQVTPFPTDEVEPCPPEQRQMCCEGCKKMAEFDSYGNTWLYLAIYDRCFYDCCSNNCASPYYPWGFMD